MTTIDRTEPGNRLPDGTRTMWVCEAAVRALAVVAGTFALTSALGELTWAPVAVAVAALPYVAFVPRERHRRWRWALHEEELDLLHGVWRVRRTIVPITRIQHVAVERTGWTRLFDLVRLHAYTAAGGVTLPGLARAQADELRDRILARLRTPDDL